MLRKWQDMKAISNTQSINTHKKKELPGLVSEELHRKGVVQSYKGVLGPVAREDILAMRTKAPACRVL